MSRAYRPARWMIRSRQWSGISKSQISWMCAEIDDKVKAFLARPIEGDWMYLWIDAIYVTVRQNGRIVSAAVIVAVGVNSNGRREVLGGMDMGPSEAETSWTASCVSSPAAVSATSS
jgi:putative transposase